ncbi:MAG: preprotein translocase subunit SecG [Oxalobacter sp.]|nr:MAG: preprotein translocase subunit SecG [Oxalobacter sp.]
MSSISTIIIIVQVLSALAIIGLVLVQQGKGADMGAAFGSGASGSLFGATGSSNFLSRSTAIAAVIFFSATLALTLVGNTNRRAPEAGAGVMENVPAAAVEKVAVPAAKKVEEPLPPVPGQAGQIPK